MYNLRKIYNRIIVAEAKGDASVMGTSRNKALSNAVIDRHPITFWYSGPRSKVKSGRRINAKPVAIGRSKRGYLILRAYVQPPSTSKKGFNEHGWRTFIIGSMTKLEINKDEIFEITDLGPEYKPNQDDKSMNVTYVKSKWDEDEDGLPDLPEPKPKDADKFQDIDNKPPVEPEKPEPVDSEPDIEPDDDIFAPTDASEPEVTDLELPEPEEPELSEPQNIEPNNIPDNKPAVNPPQDLDDIDPDERNDDEEKLNEEIKRIKFLLSY